MSKIAACSGALVAANAFVGPLVTSKSSSLRGSVGASRSNASSGGVSMALGVSVAGLAAAMARPSRPVCKAYDASKAARDREAMLSGWNLIDIKSLECRRKEVVRMNAWEPGRDHLTGSTRGFIKVWINACTTLNQCVGNIQGVWVGHGSTGVTLGVWARRSAPATPCSSGIPSAPRSKSRRFERVEATAAGTARSATSTAVALWS